jgi:hypothetical protein
MPTLSVTDEQIIDLIRQLPPDRRRKIISELATESSEEREARRDRTEQKLREVAAQRGLVWDSMDDDQRMALVDDLIHEDR